MHHLLRTLPLTAALCLASVTAKGADEIPKSLQVGTVEIDGKKVDVLVDSKRFTVYSFDKDEKDKTNCYNACAKAWPPVYLLETEKKEDVKAPFGTVTRTDSTKLQVTVDGKPLYLYKDDEKVGDVTGDNIGKVWHVVKFKKP